MECEIFNRFVSFSKEEHKYLDNSDNEWLKHSTKDVNKAGDQEKNWFFLLHIFLGFKIFIDVFENI